MMLVSGVKDIISAYKEYKIVKLQCEVEIERIRAERDKVVSELQAKREMMQSFFQMSFAERASNFERSFDLLDKAIQDGNSEAINASLTIIVTTIQTSPLADFASFDKALQDPGTTFEF